MKWDRCELGAIRVAANRDSRHLRSSVVLFAPKQEAEWRSSELLVIASARGVGQLRALRLDWLWARITFSMFHASSEKLLCAGTTPILEKTLRECRGKWKSFMWVPINSARFAPGVAPRIVGFVLLKTWDAIPRMELRIPTTSFWIPRVALRIPWNSRRAPSMDFSLRECLKLGSSSGFWFKAPSGWSTETELSTPRT